METLGAMTGNGLAACPSRQSDEQVHVSAQRRQSYADEVAALCGIKDPLLKRAFAEIAREDFLPPGPWLIETAGGAHYVSNDASPDCILHGVGVVLDRRRALNNASPARVGRTNEEAGFRPGQTVLHVGAGLGYYTAIMAELVGPTGRVIAAEIDPSLAGQAAQNLAPWPNIEMAGDALAFALPSLDRIFVSCGAAAIPRRWIEALRPDGRLMLPLTGGQNGGLLFRIRRAGASSRFSAVPLNSVLFYPCLGLRDQARVLAFDAAMQDGRAVSVRSLRLDPHIPDRDCWLHGDDWCLSTAAVATL
jgi:protein-L-isoaspartate(D-aspartate) O-methyltransferase